MLTRLRVQGFKNLRDVTVRFGPFTCIAGLNAAGKSNLFDAIRFLHLLSQKPIMEAVASLRDVRGRAPSPEELFTRFGDYTADLMRFTADLIVAPKLEDEFGVEATVALTSLRYEVAFRRSTDGSGILELAHEELNPVKLGDAREFLGFPHSKDFRASVIKGRRTTSLVSTSKEPNGPVVTAHQEGHGGRKVPAPKSTRTVVGGLASADFPSILAANREMASWRTLMLEPSAMRAPSLYRDPREIDSRGANMPNAIFRLIKSERTKGQVRAEIANRLSRLVQDVMDVRVTEDERFETRTLALCGRDGVFHPAHSLSDGTLRFLVLTVLELDPEARGLICLEEPENGIHPERVDAIVQLLRDIAVDPELAVDEDNPLRQVIINTHSPLVVNSVPQQDLVYFEQERLRVNGSVGPVAATFVLPDTWRTANDESAERLAPGQMASYLGRGRPREGERGQLMFDWLRERVGQD